MPATGRENLRLSPSSPERGAGSSFPLSPLPPQCLAQHLILSGCWSLILTCFPNITAVQKSAGISAPLSTLLWTQPRSGTGHLQPPDASLLRSEGSLNNHGCHFSALMPVRLRVPPSCSATQMEKHPGAGPWVRQVNHEDQADPASATWKPTAQPKRTDPGISGILTIRALKEMHKVS